VRDSHQANAPETPQASVLASALGAPDRIDAQDTTGTASAPHTTDTHDATGAAHVPGTAVGAGTAGGQVRVGVLGAGRMGLPIIGHLARHGFPTTVYDPDQAKRPAVEATGARFTDAAVKIAETCAVVLVCVGYEEQVTGLLTGEPGGGTGQTGRLISEPASGTGQTGRLAGEPATGAGRIGLLSRMKPDTTVAVLSTISPERMVALAGQAAGFGVHVVDATVCRGGDAADRGDLLSFAGGPAAVVERITPVLRAYSADVVHTGDVGTAQAAKAVNNLILWACLVADHEGLALAAHYGVDLEALRAALLTSSSANTALRNWGRQTMAWAEDDMRIVADMAVRAGVSLPQAGVNREICRALKPRRYQLEAYGR
jgi:3-hydroxyisobutyrate dehydrogenase